MRTICVFYNSKKSIKPGALKIINYLRQNGYKLYLNRSSAKAQLVLALGGDGTALRSIHSALPHHLPILPVSLGRLNFLAGAGVRNLPDALEKFYSGKYKTSVRHTLDITVHTGWRKIRAVAVNEAALTRNGFQRLFDITARAGRTISQWRADGLIVATPTGSTAYNLAAGGKILSPQTKKYVLTPLCPFFQSKHKINRAARIIDLQQPVFIQADGKKPNFVIVCDGHRVIKFRPGDTLEVRRGKNTYSLVNF